MIIAIANQKGGSAKTTTTVNLAACLASPRKKVLVVDMDPQGQSTLHLGLPHHELEFSVYDVLLGSAKIKKVIQKTATKNLDVLPANIHLSGAEVELVSVIGRESILKEHLESLNSKYDYILIDAPPSLGLLTINSLNAAEGVIIPVQAEFFALEGTGKLMQTVGLVRERLNPELKIFGVVVTRYNSRKNICKDVASQIEEHFPKEMFKTKIRENVKLIEASSHGEHILQYAENCNGAVDYKKLAREVVKRG